MKIIYFSRKLSALVLSIFLGCWASVSVSAQTKISSPRNMFGVETDVQAGRNAALEVERTSQVVNDSQIDSYINSVGQRLVAAIPSQFNHPEFRYSFKVVNSRDVNAFALPGGPMFVNRGLILAARNEGELAGVMAHEISHVALRHGTAQASKSYIAQGALGALGAILGGGVGAQVAQEVGGLGASTLFLKFSRDFETQADVLGSQIMTRAGYDPRDLANMFRTLQSQSGSRGPQFLSDHPNPTNRLERINQESSQLPVRSNATHNTEQFEVVKSRLRNMSGGSSGTVYGRNATSTSPTSSTSAKYRVESPSGRFNSYSSGNFSLSVPDNWRQLNDNGTITFAPNGAYG
ncbi:MAG: M48 family metallopeptidase, partial [Pyrinomonadaceae bacterium]